MESVDRCARRGTGRVGRIMVVCWLLSGMAANTAWSQGTEAVEFQIPEQPLAASLNTMALQAKIQIVFEPGPVAGLRAPALAGTMSVSQALRTLLANTSLDFVQDSDGTVVVKPRAVARSPATRRRLVAAPVAAQAPANALATVMQEEEGPWTLRARGGYREFADRGNLSADDRWSADIAAEYRINARMSTELALGFPNDHRLWLRRPAPDTPVAIDEFRMDSHFLMFKYNFPGTSLRPYLGFGLNYTRLHGQDSAVAAMDRNNWAPAAQAGFDLTLGTHWLLNADVKYARLRPGLSLPGQPASHMTMDPVFFGIGVGYRFGVLRAVPVLAASAPPAPRPPAPIAPLPPPPDPVPAATDSDQDAVPDAADRCPGTLAGLKVDTEGCEIETAMLTGVAFQTNSAELTTESSAVLDMVVAALRQRSGAKAEIHGHTDDSGTEAYNRRLSERRAAAVVDYLKQHGIAGEGLSSQGHGESQPIAPNNTAEGRARNRRVTVTFFRAAVKQAISR